MIQLGCVRLPDGSTPTKPGLRIDAETPLAIDEGPRYVSRGGAKLEAAIDHFQPALGGVVAIDIGASTGGFTDCLLQHGAAKVYAVDVGYGQLAWTLRQDPRVVVMERINARNLTPDMLAERPAFFVADCSFISLKLVLPPLRALLEPGAAGIVLIKPQFEAGRDQVGKGGVVRDPAVHERVVQQVLSDATAIGFDEIGVIPSPLLGPAGNREFLAYLRMPVHA
jgi:23S rRNA (cytidine1920-2'-O)/16S rRNA (cytidine1409-2'-O)-methyltransferase